MKKVAIIIPIYKDNLSLHEDISLKRALKVFKNRDIILVTFFELKHYCTQIKKNHSNITIQIFDKKNFNSIRSYNRLLMSENFYKAFINFNYILICQLDVYVFEDKLDYWIEKQYCNIGAPLFKGYNKTSKVFRDFGNNGGFCLRKTQSCLDILSNIKYRFYNLSTLVKIESSFPWKLYRILRDGLLFNYNYKFFYPIINEDIFWSSIVPIENKLFLVPKPEEAMLFSFDANPKLLYEKSNNKLPMAIHAWWRDDMIFVEKLIKSQTDAEEK
jgi:hypothetical protein